MKGSRLFSFALVTAVATTLASAKWSFGQTIITVNNTADTAPANSCNSGTPCSLRSAIIVANGISINKIIQFGIPSSDSGCVNGVCTINLSSALPDLSTPVFISGPGADKLIVRRNTGGDYRIFNVTSTGTVSLSGLTISNGDAITNSGNNAGEGGGIRHVSAGTLNVTDCAVTGNSAGSPSLSGLGGGIYNSGGTVNITGCTISGNIVNSSAGGGGGITHNGGTLTITNSTISGNSTQLFAGGILNANNGTLKVSNSTVTGNVVTAGTQNDGGGILSSSGTVTVKSSIIALNSGNVPDVSGSFSSAGFNVIGKTDGSTGFTALTDKTGTIAAPLDPALDPLGLQSNGGPTMTIALLCGSPAIDQASSVPLAGSNVATDQRGLPRFDDPAKTNANGGDGTDAGAFERQQSCPISGNLTVTTTADTNNGFCGANCSLRDALNAANGNANSKVINFANGLQGTIQLIGPLPKVANDVSIQGPGANVLTVRRNTGGDYRVLTISNGTTTGPVVSISGLTLSNGKAAGSPNQGGALLNDHGTLTLSDITLSDNAATNGAGIYNNGTSGGSATLTISNSTLARNAGNFGGALFNHGFQGSATANITNTTISDNTAGRGAAVHNGGASGDANLELRNCTISNNSALLGGIYNDGASGHAGIFTGNTIFKTGSTGPNLTNSSGAISSRGSNISNDAAGGDGTTNPGGFLSGSSDKRNTDPKLDGNGLQSNGGPTQTIALLSNSPAINSGNDTLAPVKDQRGFARAGTSDIGAFEFGGSAPPPTPTPSPIPSSTPTATPTATATPVTTLGNISTRLRVETGDSVLIGGFIITGTQPKKVIVRGIGTSLPLADKLADPTLELHGPNGLIEANDNWVDSPNKQAIIDSTVPPSSDLESAIVQTLPANSAGYTAIVRGVNNGTGIGVVEAYDLDTTVDSRLANISTRGFVQTGDNVLIAGTIILGQLPQKVIIRAIGTSLSIAGKLENPTLELRNQNGGLIEANDNWVDSPNKQAIIDSTIPPTNDLESAIVQTLPANNAQYTAIVRGVNNTTGIAVVEVYALQ